ncbi:MAG: response regulator, partial [Planctomycetota bacterium]|nr:response regulator [Planctomycetota bacterium]
VQRRPGRRADRLGFHRDFAQKGARDVSDGLTILVVDDDQDFLEQMQFQLTAAGFTVETAGSERQAREILDSRDVDAAVVDLMLENADGGFSLCHYIKGRKTPVPVILVTGVTHETGLEFDAATSE